MEAQEDAETFNNELQDLKKMNNTITEMKNTVEEIDRRITEAEQQISELEDRVVEIPVTEEKRMKKKMRTVSETSWEKKRKVSQSCLTLCNLTYYTVHGILQSRILEWVAFPFSRGSSQPKD